MQKTADSYLQKYVTVSNIAYVLLGYVVVKTSLATLAFIRAKLRQREYTHITTEFLAKRNQKVLALRIPETPHVSLDVQEQVLGADVTELKRLLEEGKVTSEDILNIYMRRVLTVGLEHEAFTEINYENALKRARQLDTLRKTNPEQCRGELFGIVMTVKDTIDIQGLPSTIGCASRINYIPKEDGQCAKILQSAGAILFVKSNVPQVAMTFDSSNFVYGQGKNLWDKSRVIGGSSGGEAALVAMRCAPLGIGSDIGGSLRFPPSFCGVVGLKPGTTRLSSKGHTKYEPEFDGQFGIPATIGPIAKSVEDCAVFMRAFLNNNKYYEELKSSERDLYYRPQPFNEDLYKSTKKLRIGFYKSLSYLPAAECVQQGVERARLALVKKGHELIEIEMPQLDRIVHVFFQCMLGDGARAVLRMIDGEKTIPAYESFLLSTKLSKRMQKIVAWLLNKLGERRLSDVARASQAISAADDRCNNSEIRDLRDFYINYLREKLRIDAIICPSFATPAVKHELVDPLTIFSVYCAIWNTLDFPAGVVPVSLVRQDEQNYSTSNYSDLVHKKTVENMKESAGLPVSVQVVTLPYEEELCLNIMRQIEEAVQFRKNHPYPV